jgi:23S rRNA G2445 N2-methylase RlmL
MIRRRFAIALLALGTVAGYGSALCSWSHHRHARHAAVVEPGGERVVQGARDNARGLELEGRVELLAGNARVLKELTGSGAADVIVTNPPWGVRLGKCDDIDEL